MSLPNKFNGVLLDLDNTVYDYNRANKAALLAVEQYFQKTFAIEKGVFIEKFLQAKTDVQKRLFGTAASHNRLLYFQRMFELLKVTSFLSVLDCYELYWSVFLENMYLREGMKDFLMRMHNNKKICLVTDLTAHIQYKKIKKLALDECLHYIVSSEEVGKEKPHKDIFTLALQKLSCRAENVCMIGDDYHRDVLGATQLGIHTFWLTDHYENNMLGGLVTPFKSIGELERFF